jgi:hypothetical protein
MKGITLPRTFYHWTSVQEELDRAAHAETLGMSMQAQRHLYRALLIEEQELENRRAAERMARESDACMEHRSSRPDCPRCL